MPHGKGTYGSTKGRPPKRQTGKKTTTKPSQNLLKNIRN